MTARKCLGAAIVLALVAAVAWISWPAPPVYSREIALEYLGPDFRSDWTDPESKIVNGNAYHWTHLLGIPFTSDIHIDVKDVPLDLDVDGAVDVVVTQKIDLPGGVVGNAEYFGLVRTPDDPAGKAGRYSVSTGFFGVREEMDPATKKGTGRFGFACGACHGGTNPVTGRPILGSPSVDLEWGVMVAGAAAIRKDHVIDIDGDGAPDPVETIRRRNRVPESADLDPDRDGRVTIAEFRAALGFEPSEVVQARLLLAGPGRQDQSSEFGQDESVPGIMRTEYADGVERWLKKPRPAYFNPVSLPSHIGLVGIDGLNWSGIDSAVDIDFAERIEKMTGKSQKSIARWLGVGTTDRRVVNRTLALDKRNIETFSLNSDSWYGLEWSDALDMNRDMDPGRFIDFVPRAFEVKALRNTIRDEIPPEAVHPGLDPAKVARGREVFSRRIVGRIRNEQVLYQPPEKHKRNGMGRNLYLAPIDTARPLDSLVDVKCSTCHNYSVSDERTPLAEATAVHGRCFECHASHPGIPRREIDLRPDAMEPTENCLECHANHRDFGFQSYSRSFLLPFDADGDGVTKGDDADDARAGGIGTDPMYAVNPENSRFYYVALDDGAKPPRIDDKTIRAFGWIRVAPLRGVFATAPYLHNGSVPTLHDLLRKPEARPAAFPVGPKERGFVLDTSLPGNRRGGHDFGSDLPDAERDDLVEFLKSL